MSADFWSDSRVERLRAHVAAKHSAKTAAVDLGCGRGAAVGKAARLGLQFASQKPPHRKSGQVVTITAARRRPPTPAAIRLAAYDPIVARAIAS